MADGRSRPSLGSSVTTSRQIQRQMSTVMGATTYEATAWASFSWAMPTTRQSYTTGLQRPRPSGRRSVSAVTTTMGRQRVMGQRRLWPRASFPALRDGRDRPIKRVALPVTAATVRPFTVQPMNACCRNRPSRPRAWDATRTQPVAASATHRFRRALLTISKKAWGWPLITTWGAHSTQLLAPLRWNARAVTTPISSLVAIGRSINQE